MSQLRRSICSARISALKLAQGKYVMAAFNSKRRHGTKYTGLCHFTKLFCRRPQRNVQRFKTHVYNHCFALNIFSSPQWLGNSLISNLTWKTFIIKSWPRFVLPNTDPLRETKWKSANAYSSYFTTHLLRVVRHQYFLQKLEKDNWSVWGWEVMNR